MELASYLEGGGGGGGALMWMKHMHINEKTYDDVDEILVL